MIVSLKIDRLSYIKKKFDRLSFFFKLTLDIYITLKKNKGDR